MFISKDNSHHFNQIKTSRRSSTFLALQTMRNKALFVKPFILKYICCNSSYVLSIRVTKLYPESINRRYLFTDMI